MKSVCKFPLVVYRENESLICFCFRCRKSYAEDDDYEPLLRSDESEAVDTEDDDDDGSVATDDFSGEEDETSKTKNRQRSVKTPIRRCGRPSKNACGKSASKTELVTPKVGFVA